jgi:hypothetical protein
MNVAYSYLRRVYVLQRSMCLTAQNSIRTSENPPSKHLGDKPSADVSKPASWHYPWCRSAGENACSQSVKEGGLLCRPTS